MSHWLMIIALLFSSAMASAQDVTGPTAPGRPRPETVQDELPICVSVRNIFERVIVTGRGRPMEITIGGGACEPPGSGISDLSVVYRKGDGIGDVVEAENCPVFARRVATLWRSRQIQSGSKRNATAVKIGQFVFVADAKGLFDLQTLPGKQAAARWLINTIHAVTLCWNNVREDKTHHAATALSRLLAK